MCCSVQLTSSSVKNDINTPLVAFSNGGCTMPESLLKNNRPFSYGVLAYHLLFCRLFQTGSIHPLPRLPQFSRCKDLPQFSRCKDLPQFSRCRDLPQFSRYRDLLLLLLLLKLKDLLRWGACLCY